MSNRGRPSIRSKSTTRKPSQPRPSRGALSFFSKEVQEEERAKKANIAADVEDLNKYIDKIKVDKTKPSQQHTISQQANKVSKTIEAGKEFVSKFFRGFAQPERGNIKVTIDSTLPGRMTNPYVDKIKSYTELKFQHEPEEKFAKYFNQFQGITEIGIAIKLQKSATEYQRNLNFKFTSIRNLDLPLPKKLNVLINQLGKTDLPNDNRIRLKHQHLLVKRFMLRGSTIFLQDEMEQFLNNDYKAKNLIKLLNHSESFDRILDNSLGSLTLLKTIGRQYFEDMTETNYDFKIKTKSYSLRLPRFNYQPDEGIKVSDIVEYFKNDLFLDFDFEQEAIYKIIASLVFQVANFSWLRNRNKTIGELNEEFADTVVKNYTFQEILDYADIRFLDQFIDEDILDDVVNEVIKKWKTGSLHIFNQMFNMEEVRYSDYGSDSQLIEITEFQKKKNELDIPYSKIVNRSKAETVLKTSEHGAILGLTLAIAKKVEFSSKFEINFDSKNDQILQEFVKSDFKA